MSEYVEVGTAIIAEKIKINTIKVTLGKRPHIMNDKLFYPFSVARGGVVEIITPLELHDVPRKFLNEKFLYTEEGATLNAKRLWAVLIDYKMTDKNKKERLMSEVEGIHAKVWKFKEKFAMP